MSPVRHRRHGSDTTTTEREFQGSSGSGEPLVDRVLLNAAVATSGVNKVTIRAPDAAHAPGRYIAAWLGDGDGDGHASVPKAEGAVHTGG